MSLRPEYEEIQVVKLAMSLHRNTEMLSFKGIVMNSFIRTAGFLFVLAACSKQSPVIETRTKEVEVNMKTYSALQASEELLGQFDEIGQERVISRILAYRRSDFNWNKFWLDVEKNIETSLLSDKQVKNLISLIPFSCQEMPSVSVNLLHFVKSETELSLKVSSARSGLWLEQYSQLLQDCRLGHEAKIMLDFAKIASEAILKDDSKLRSFAVELLNKWVKKEEDSFWLRSLKDSLYKEGDLVLVKDIESLSQEELLSFAHLFEVLFPYKKNPFIARLAENSKDVASLNEIISIQGLRKSLEYVGKLKVDEDKVSTLSSHFLKQFLSQTIPELKGEEAEVLFGQTLEVSNLLFALLEKEVELKGSHEVVLDKLEDLVLRLENILLTTNNPSRLLERFAPAPLILILDMRLAKRLEGALLHVPRKINKIKSLTDVTQLFHYMYSANKKPLLLDAIKTYCAWAPDHELDHFEESTPLKNGCNNLKQVKNQKGASFSGNSYRTPLFSVLNLPGLNLTLKFKNVDLSVLNLTQDLSPEKSDEEDDRSLMDPIVLPLVLGFDLMEPVRELKTDRTYYFTYHFILRPSLNGETHEITVSEEGYGGGNLTLKLEDRIVSVKPTFISLGSEAADPGEGKEGGKNLSYSIDLYHLSRMLMMPNGAGRGNEIYPLDTLSMKNLDSLIKKMRSGNSTKKTLKVDPEYLNFIGSEAKAVFEESLKLAKDQKLLSKDASLELIAGLAMDQLQGDISESLKAGDLLSSHPSLSTFFEMPAGKKGPAQERGRSGQKGEVIYE